MLTTKELKSVIDSLEDATDILNFLRESLCQKREDIIRKCNEVKSEDCEEKKIDFIKFRRLESIVYDIVSGKDISFITTLTDVFDDFDVHCFKFHPEELEACDDRE